MSYYFAKTLPGKNSDDVVSQVTDALQDQGFGILTEIDVRATMKNKRDKDFRDYRIRGACNPPLAHQGLVTKDKIGTMLPCNVIVQKTPNGEFEIAAVDPAASMQVVDNPNLEKIAETVREKLKQVIDVLQRY